MNIRWTLPALTGLVAVAACGDTASNEGLVARAGDHVLTVDEAVELLVDEENLPNETQVVNALAELWVDYTLLASAVAEDSTLKDVDLEPLVRQQLEQEMIFQLRDSVIQVDTLISDADLEELYRQEAPDAQVRARHILLGFPENASEAQRDSVQQLAESLRQRAVRGEDFATLAREFSQDPGSAALGGDLGTFGRGDMVRPFEDAAFAMDQGDVSDVVESPFGLHVIQVQEKVVPDFDAVRDAFRNSVKNRRYLQAESAYVAGVEVRANPTIAESAFGVVRELARDPGTQLSRRAANRPLATFGGGSFTVGDFQVFAQTRQPSFLQQVAAGTDEQLELFLKGLVQRELLVTEAESAGLEPDRERVDSLIGLAGQQLLGAANTLGLRRLDQAPGEPLAPAVTRAVNRALADIITGAKDPLPLGQIGFQLRSAKTATIFETGVGQVILQVGRIRASRSPAPVDAAPDTAAGAGSGGN